MEIVVTEEMVRAGDAAIEAYELPAAFPSPLDARLCAHIYRAMSALDPSRRAPNVTREQILTAVTNNLGALRPPDDPKTGPIALIAWNAEELIANALFALFCTT